MGKDLGHLGDDLRAYGELGKLSKDEIDYRKWWWGKAIGFATHFTVMVTTIIVVAITVAGIYYCNRPTLDIKKIDAEEGVFEIYLRNE